MNSLFGSELSSPQQAGEVEAALLAQLDSLDRKLDTANSSAPTQLYTALASCEQLQVQVDRLSEEQDTAMVEAREVVEQVRNFRGENVELVGDIGCVRGVVQYSVWLQLVAELSREVEEGLGEGGLQGGLAALQAFLRLRGVREALAESRCCHLRKYVVEAVTYWYQRLHDSLMARLEEGLAGLGWPFVQLEDSRRVAEVTSCTVSVQEVQGLCRSLLQLQEPELASAEQHTLVMKALLKPLKKRFRYHFLGSKSTNNPAKPEWYCTQLVLWATAHRDFLSLHIQPVYDQEELALPATLEFGAGLVSLAREKLGLDLPLVHADDILLAHTIDETIVLARELAAQLLYSSAQPSVLGPLTHQPVFSRWLNMERKFAFEKLDSVLSAGEGVEPWQPELDSGLVPRAAEAFLAVLLSVTER